MFLPGLRRSATQSLRRRDPSGQSALLLRLDLSRSSTSRHGRGRRLHGHQDAPTHGTRGPVVRRSQSPTHLDDVEDAVTSTQRHYQQRRRGTDAPSTPSPRSQRVMSLDSHQNVRQHPPRDREMIGVASHLQRRLLGLSERGDCRRCWLPTRRCVCRHCVPLEVEGRAKEGGPINVDRLFLLVSGSREMMVGSEVVLEKC